MTPQRVMLWYLPAALIGALSGLMAVETAAANTSRPVNCNRMCGDVSIPYPFGIGHDCAWPSPGFNISCNHSFSPPKPYLGNIEIIGISLEAGEARIYTAVLLDCFTSYNTTEHDDKQTDNSWQLYLHDSPFLFAPSKNEFTGIGCGTARRHQLGRRCRRRFGISNPEWNRSAPCSYAFVAEKGWYNFSRQDFGRNGSRSFTMSDGFRSVPTVLDWAIRSNGSCSLVPPGAPSCVSAHSYCVNATNGNGYLYNCSTGYAGNPYVVGGCTKQYPCQYGTCHDLEGGYECKCSFGRKRDNNNSNSISLQVRLDIAIESTEALAYLHTSANQKVLHGDIKSSNILIDNEFIPKVADFGISRLLPKTKHHTSLVVGDRSYMDPIYFRTRLLTEKSDFGIVLLELITRKKAKYGENKSLQIDFVTSYKTDSRAREMFDNEIASPEVIGCLDMISRIAFQCLKDDVDERPTMEQVLEQLHLVRKELMGAKTRALELTNQIDWQTCLPRRMP
uniref:Protein kinase domain-containing protein n=1 Tax=Leersia perrieri TaxID=77586 RepID=A0A0D9XVJ0_9ORYZ